MTQNNSDISQQIPKESEISAADDEGTESLGEYFIDYYNIMSCLLL